MGVRLITRLQKEMWWGRHSAFKKDGLLYQSALVSNLMIEDLSTLSYFSFFPD